MRKINLHRCGASRLCILCLLLVFSSCKKSGESKNGPLKPAEAVSSFQLEPGFRIDMIAAEPLVADPVDMEVDEYGRLYVVEMHGYPLDKSGAGQIKLLSDTDGDGQFDKSTLFADSLTLPFGIMRWKNGVLVADAPHIFYLEDSDDDGKADIKKTVLTGFAFSNAQMNAGNPLYGLDNWIYLTSESGGTYQIYKNEFGDLGSDIHFPGVDGSPRLRLEGSGRTVRFRPDVNALELTSGVTQFGHDFDQWGHHLLGNNSNHIYHEVISASYLSRNPHVRVASATQTLSDHGSEVFSGTKNPERQLLTNVGVFTSACGNIIYSGGNFPAPFNDNVTFVCEPVSNIVHADKLTPEGASFKGSRVGNGPNKEFLMSADAWFRPVNMYVGPDGALYLLDYYRQVIEHPEWMSAEAVNSGTLYNGKDMGRIYRISPEGSAPAAWMGKVKLGDYSGEALVGELANPNGWWRRNAQRLLVDRGDKSVVPALINMADTSTSATGRLHALWTLEGLGALEVEIIARALGDSTAGIRENAIKLSELHPEHFSRLQDRLLLLESDPDPKVRFQLLCTLGSIDHPKVVAARNRMLFADLNDKWIQIAALSASVTRVDDLLRKLIDAYQPDVPAYASMVQRLTAMAASGGTPEKIQALIEQALRRGPAQDYAWQASILEGVAEGLQSRKFSDAIFGHEERLLISAFFEHPSSAIRTNAVRILKIGGIQGDKAWALAAARAVRLAADSQLPDARRAEAVTFLGVDDPSEQSSFLKNLIRPQEKIAVQLAAINTLSVIPGKAVSDHILASWETLTPEIRTVALNTFLSSDERVASLLDAIDSGRVQKASVSFNQSVRLMTTRNETLRARARLLFAENDEQQASKDYQQALVMTGDTNNGKNIYQKLCSMCHQVRGTTGVAFGPDLGTISNWQAEGILANIVAPNLAIAAGYELWDIALTNGESVQGIIASETPAAISVKSAGDAVRIISRGDIRDLKTLSISGMPAGLVQNISQQEMADLLAFLRQKQ